MMRLIIFLLTLTLISCTVTPDMGEHVKTELKGKLFIIGGGKRPLSLMAEMVNAADLSKDDYIAILPMASIEPDTAFYYAKIQFQEVTDVPVYQVFFDSSGVYPQGLLDTLRGAKLIYMTGGDQNRLMRVGKQTAFKDALKVAYTNGSTIAGTSAGAAVMSKIMITGDQRFVPAYEPTFDRLWKDNLLTAEGMGFLENTIIDQHFIARSRYNRILSCLAAYPEKMVIGIDESTAILVEGDSATVVGTSQIVVIENTQIIPQTDTLLRLEHVSLSVLPKGSKFKIK